MIALIDIRKAAVDLLKSKFNYKIYGKEVREGFGTPSFFIDIATISNDYMSSSIQSVQRTITITYFQETWDSLDNEKMFEELKKLFGLKFEVADRKLNVLGPKLSYTGEWNEIMQFSFDINYNDEIDYSDPENFENMGEIILNEGSDV